MIKPNPTTETKTCEECKPLFETSTFTVIRNERFVDVQWDELTESERRAIYVNLFSPCEIY